MTAPGAVQVSTLDAAEAETCRELLRRACASGRWVELMTTGRPHGSLVALLAASDRCLGELTWADVLEALDAHPRIGERAAGTDLEAQWSRREQEATAGASGEVRERLRVGNVAYEQRFGHVFLIRASGRSSDEMLAALESRIANPPDDERAVVREQLREIVRLRLQKAFR